ncbi:hypothetical protein EMCRGX_G017153 [Ephydatia muelleri]
MPCFFMISFRTCPPLCLVIPHCLARSDQLTTLLGDQDCASSRRFCTTVLCSSTSRLPVSTNVAVLILSNFFQLFLLAITVLRIDYQLCFWSGRKDFYSCLPKMLLGDCV